MWRLLRRGPFTNAEVPNTTAPATVNLPATEARVPATPIATISEVTTETAVPPEQEHVFLSVEVIPNKTAPSIDVSSDDYVDAGEEYFPRSQTRRDRLRDGRLCQARERRRLRAKDDG